LYCLTIRSKCDPALLPSALPIATIYISMKQPHAEQIQDRWRGIELCAHCTVVFRIACKEEIKRWIVLRRLRACRCRTARSQLCPGSAACGRSTLHLPPHVALTVWVGVHTVDCRVQREEFSHPSATGPGECRRSYGWRRRPLGTDSAESPHWGRFAKPTLGIA
jgi:hypothetical protein